MVSKDSVDPGLSCGWAYFVEETAYKKFIQSHGGTLQQVSFDHTSLPYIDLTSCFVRKARVRRTTP